MASRRAEEYWAKGSWQAQGYRSEPGSSDIPPGRSGEALLRSDTAEISIAGNQEVPEMYSPTASTYTGHHAGPRTVAAEWYPVSQILRVHFPASSPASGGAHNYFNVSEDDWLSFQSAASPGRWINDHAFSYGQAAAPTPQAATEDTDGEESR